MLNWIARLLVASVVAMWAIPAWCEYFQYRDENGVLRFTDNLASVPTEQRSGVTTHRSVDSSKKSRKAVAAEQNRPLRQGSAYRKTIPADNTWEGKKARIMAAFDRKQAELDQTFKALQSERAKLMKKVPSKKASFEEKAIYNRKITALNAKIKRYEEKLADFNQEVEDYNVKIKIK